MEYRHKKARHGVTGNKYAANDGFQEAEKKEKTVPNFAVHIVRQISQIVRFEERSVLKVREHHREEDR